MFSEPTDIAIRIIIPGNHRIGRLIAKAIVRSQTYHRFLRWLIFSS